MDTLNEGLIAVPPFMLEKIKQLIRKNVLWWARDRFEGKRRELAPLFKEFKRLVVENNIIIPHEKHENHAYSIPVDLRDMGEKYEKLEPSVEKIILYFDFGRKEDAGFWWPEKNALVICPLAVNFIQDYPSRRNHPEDLQIAIDQICETAEHELRHMVQYVLLKHQDQIKRKPKYNDHKSDYYTSQLEFDPMIGSNVGQFIQLLKLYSSKKQTSPKMISKFVKQFVGALPSSSFEMFAVTPFFKALKKTSPEKYKVAVNKFVTEVQKRIKNNELNESILNELFDSSDIEWLSEVLAIFKVGKQEYKAYFKQDAGGGNHYDFMFATQDYDDEGKKIDSTMKNTGRMGSSSPRVFGVAINCVEEFIKKKRPRSLDILGQVETGRNDLYTKMADFLSKRIDHLGYDLKIEDRPGAMSGPYRRFRLVRR